MPTYEYRCAACGYEFEAEQRIKDDPLKDCPECKAASLERLISAVGFQLKGGGWYKDLYSSSKGHRSDKQVETRLQKAVDDDKKKSSTPKSDT